MASNVRYNLLIFLLPAHIMLGTLHETKQSRTTPTPDILAVEGESQPAINAISMHQMPSLGFLPESIMALHDLCFASVAIC